MSRLIRLSIVAGALAALVVPLAASAHGGKRGGDDDRRRLLYATDTRGNLLSFAASSPRRVRSRTITGLPTGVALSGIDFRPATGDLYALGSDKVVYRVNVATAIAVAEGPAFEVAPAALNSQNTGSTSTRPWTRSASRATRTTASASTPTRAACSRRTRP
jgi:septal ring-binding cell division protein DamX